jgi:branched-chain amino acid transport system ATP-binding protein
MVLMLQVENLQAGYQRVRVLQGVNLEVRAGEVVSLLGANGAGKSTLLKTISGLVSPAGGRIHFQGRDITHGKPVDIVRAGLIQVPEGRQLFPSLTVRQNLLLGAFVHGSRRTDLEALYPLVFHLFPPLKERLGDKAGALSGGVQQMLAMARGLMARPRLLLLDEPSLGLAPLVVRNIFGIIRDLRSQGIPILLVEQNVTAALKVADRGYVMETGRIVNQGTAGELLGNDEVRKKYLGM